MTNDELMLENLELRYALRRAKEAVRRMVSAAEIERTDALEFTPSSVEGLNLQDNAKALCKLMDKCLSEVEAI